MDRIARVALRIAIAVAILGAWPGALEPFAPLKAMFLRAIGLGLLLWLGVEAWSGRVRKPNPLTWAVLAWVAVNAVSALFSYSPRLSFLGDLDQREGVLLAVALAGLHFAAGHAHRTEAQVRSTLLVALLAGIGAALYAHLQLAGADPFHWAQPTMAIDGPRALRPTGPLGDTWLLAVVLAVSLPLALARLAEENEARSTLTMVLLVPATALLASALITTLARGSWLAAVLGTTITLAGTAVAGSPVRRMVWACAVTLLPALVFGMARTAGAEGLRLAGWEGGTGANIRAIVAQGATQLWSERPWLGVGPDAFGLAYPSVQSTDLWRDGWLPLPAHAPTVVLQTLATLGILGALSGLAWVAFAAEELRTVWLARPATRGTLAGLAGAIVVLVVVGATGVVGIAGAALFAVLTALPGAMSERPAPAPADAPARRRTLPHPLLLIGPAILLVAVEVISGVTELRALTLAQRSRHAELQANATATEWRANAQQRAAAAWQAVALVPDQAELWRLASAASLDAGEAAAKDSLYDAAEFAAHRAIALEPRRASSHEALAIVLAARARREHTRILADSANAEFDRAMDRAPMDGRILSAQVRTNLELHDGVTAFTAAQELVALYPRAGMSHALVGASAYLLGRDQVARDEIRTALASRWEPDESDQKAACEHLLARLDSKAARATAPSARAPAAPPQALASSKPVRAKPAPVLAPGRKPPKLPWRPVAPRRVVKPHR